MFLHLEIYQSLFFSLIDLGIILSINGKIPPITINGASQYNYWLLILARSNNFIRVNQLLLLLCFSVKFWFMWFGCVLLLSSTFSLFVLKFVDLVPIAEVTLLIDSSVLLSLHDDTEIAKITVEIINTFDLIIFFLN